MSSSFAPIPSRESSPVSNHQGQSTVLPRQGKGHALLGTAVGGVHGQFSCSCTPKASSSAYCRWQGVVEGGGDIFLSPMPPHGRRRWGQISCFHNLRANSPMTPDRRVDSSVLPRQGAGSALLEVMPWLILAIRELAIEAFKSLHICS